MKIKVYVVDLEIPPRARRWLRGAVVTAGTLLLFATAVSAAPPHTFSNGETLTASSLMQDFNDLDGRLAALESFKAKLTRNGTTIPGTYCGKTPASYDGAGVGGRAGAKAKCQAACGNSATAQQCTSDEVMRSLAAGVDQAVMNRAWYTTGDYVIETYVNADCNGWTNNTGSYAGVTLTDSPAGASTHDICSNSRPILCCD